MKKHDSHAILLAVLNSLERYPVHVHTPTEKAVGGKVIDKQLKIKVKAPLVNCSCCLLSQSAFSQTKMKYSFPI